MSLIRGKKFILGAGITGLAAGLISKHVIFESGARAGGICSSYYIRPDTHERLFQMPNDQEVYRFEIGGGHWIWNHEPLVRRFIEALTPVKTYTRRAAVYLSDQKLLIPYPIQNHLYYLGQKLAKKIFQEIMANSKKDQPIHTMAEWLEKNFGSTLCELFFHPFHEHYTAGLWRQIAPPDASKSPIDLTLIHRGLSKKTPLVGYNVKFAYPIMGLDRLTQKMASRCKVLYEKHVVNIDVKEKTIYFADGSTVSYTALISTLPLNQMIKIANISLDHPADPFSSVLVFNIGAVQGPQCPKDHWIYISQSKNRFHRVGFYSNVDSTFLPASDRKNNKKVALYVEKSYRIDQKPTEAEIASLSRSIVRELQEWGWINEVEVVDTTWIDIAYTWSYPHSKWVKQSIDVLATHNIFQAGRFARWSLTHGIADSIRDGLVAGAVL